MKAGLIALAAGCAQLPDAGLHMGARDAPQVEIESARGALSTQRVSAILSKLSSNAGELDILQQHVAVEQAIVGSPLTAGNRVLLLQDGPATYRAMFAAIGAATTTSTSRPTSSRTTRSVGESRGAAARRSARRACAVHLHLRQRRLARHADSVLRAAARPAASRCSSSIRSIRSTRKKEWLVNNRDHRKLLVDDGRSRVHRRNQHQRRVLQRRRPSREAGEAGRRPAWRDTNCASRARWSYRFQKLFMETWAKQGGGALAASGYFPASPAQGRRTRARDRQHARRSAQPIYLTLISAISKAESHVYLTNAYFVARPRRLLDALIRAARRGVDVRLMLPGSRTRARSSTPGARTIRPCCGPA